MDKAKEKGGGKVLPFLEYAIFHFNEVHGPISQLSATVLKIEP